MARKQVYDAVKSALDGGFSACPVIYPNQTMTPPVDNGPFVEVQYPFVDAEQRTIGAPGSNILREEGAIRFVIAVPVTYGTDGIYTVANALIALFTNLRSGAFRTYVPTSPTFDDRNERNGWFVASLSVPYDHDITG